MRRREASTWLVGSGVSDRIQLTLAHSPDPDDVFMWWPITGMIEPPSHEEAQRVQPARVVSAPEVDTERFQFQSIACDIAVLNRYASAGGTLDVTALSVFAWARVRERYALTSFGASFGEGYGPKVVGRTAGTIESLRDPRVRIAIPGFGTTAFALLSMMVGDPKLRERCIEMPFDRILEAVASGDRGVTHGLLIHQSQLTYPDAGLSLVADTGAWWREATRSDQDAEGLPLPLGGNAVARSLDETYGAGSVQEVVDILARSLRYALEHRGRAVEYCRGFAPELNRAQTEEYLRMYVSDLTIDTGERGERAMRLLIQRAETTGLVEPGQPVELLKPRMSIGRT
jgi:1,4-dihydroxy-6-naphthoate synthase